MIGPGLAQDAAAQQQELLRRAQVPFLIAAAPLNLLRSKHAWGLVEPGPGLLICMLESDMGVACRRRPAEQANAADAALHVADIGKERDSATDSVGMLQKHLEQER